MATDRDGIKRQRFDAPPRLLLTGKYTMAISTTMEAEELQDLCKGKIHWRKCQDCDVDGFQYWDGFAGEGVCNNPSNIAPDRVEKGRCETCGGIAYQFYRVD